MSSKTKHPARFDLIRDGERIEKLFQLAVREELRKHKCLGNPIAVWRDGKVVIIPPQEIEIPPDPFEFPNQPNLDAW